MSHSHHESLPGYDEAAILHDGCIECEKRGEDFDRALSYMDRETFEKAWKRAAAWQKGTLDRPINDAEGVVLEGLWSVQVCLEQRGVPVGEVPGVRS